MDNLSVLPDALILHIFTFLPFRDAVRTSVLSTRWRYLWQATTNVDLNHRFFPDLTSMSDFIQRWMQIYREPQLERFCLAISNPPAIVRPLIHQCLRFALDRSVKAMEIDFSNPDFENDDDNLDVVGANVIPPQRRRRPFTVSLDSRTVLPETLGLSACDLSFEDSNSVSNPYFGVKNLFLGWMEMPGNSIMRFLALSPNLETLILKGCWDVGNLEIDSGTLKVLVMEKCRGLESFSVSSPKLEFLNYSTRLPQAHLQIENVPSVREVVLDLGFQQWRNDDEHTHSIMLFDLLAQDWAVQALTICSYTLQALPLVGNLVLLKPSLGRTTHLCLRTQLHAQEYYGITFFLNMCSKLDLLSIHLTQTKIFEDYRWPYRVEDHPFASGLWHPSCFDKTLRTVEIKGFKGSTNEMVVLRYILRFGKVLQNLVIQATREDDGMGEETSRARARARDRIRRLLQYEVIASPVLKVHVR
ncbi:putative F-box/LRR-repeat protein At5g54820 [Andrographis paniculata]|uniref:putative F-box/LRR-repeat protein At5g54820 n=1 Tax=Andrographis paniculata TaxID=175694 RepID=UPI0021E8CA80|nr:putative F-box/LRR-repeat protein At5g54820 [Andrographis paniculata]